MFQRLGTIWIFPEMETAAASSVKQFQSHKIQGFVGKCILWLLDRVLGLLFSCMRFEERKLQKVVRF
ncbi:hypothetical protein V6N11_002868 [Hibiscus sabdariffa]|uniref:Uncharacterized protein n=1 Tax=Hibiscus sabdariffa TaxID=183260 RepID=A0ABR2SBM8_9ROSI